MARYHKHNNRFDTKGNCNCVHITEGTCKQCTVCDCCEYYKVDINKIEPVQNMGKIVGNGFYVGNSYFRFK